MNCEIDMFKKFEPNFQEMQPDAAICDESVSDLLWTIS